MIFGINATCDISKLSQISLALRLLKLRITIISKYHSWYLCQISLQIMLLPILTIINFQSLHAVTRKECKTYLQTWYTKNKNIFIAEKIDFIQKYRVNFPKFKIKNLLLVLFHRLKTVTQTSLKLYMWMLSVSANCCTCEWLGNQYFSWEMNNFLLKSFLVMNIQECWFLETQDSKVDSGVVNLDSFEFWGSALHIEQTRYKLCQ